MNTVNSFQFQSVQGPADGDRRHSLTEGYQPVSRIGEVVINSFGLKAAHPTRTFAHPNRDSRTEFA